jgi:hypothetical protein
MNPLIQHLQITTQTRFDPRGTPQPITEYSYYILQHGPFRDDYTHGMDTVEAVQAAMAARIEKIRAVGGIPAGQ